MVHVVSSQSEEDMERRDTRNGLVWPLRELTANLLRIANGAGKPWELMKQLSACHEALRQYAEAHRHLPPEGMTYQVIDRVFYLLAALSVACAAGLAACLMFE
jgi:hypothetical protein